MRVHGGHVLLAAIFVAALLARLIISFSSDGYSYDAYFSIRKVELLLGSGFPSFDDGLSYSSTPFMPLFHYALAFFRLFLGPELVFRVIPNLMASLSVPLAYLISFEMTRSRLAGLFSAFSVAFVPVFFLSTVNSVSQYSLVVPLVLLCVYLLIRLEEGGFVRQRFVLMFVASSVALALSSPSSVIFVSGLLLYVLLLFILRARISRAELEVISFSVMASLWVVFLFFKELLYVHGFSAIRPSAQGSGFGFDMLDSIYLVGVLTFMAGFFVCYNYVFEARRRDVHILISLSLMVIALIYLRLIGLSVGLMFLGVFFAVMSGEAYAGIFGYIRKTHMAKSINLVVASSVVAVAFTSGIPSLLYFSSSFFDEPSSRELSAFEWVGSESPEGSVVFSDLKEGWLVSSVSGRRAFVDGSLMMARDSGARVADMERIYSSRSQVAALELIERYDISYMVVTRHALSSRNLSGLAYLSDDCFDLVFENAEAAIYRPICRVSS